MSTAIQAPPEPKRRRGRESAYDMLRSLGLCLLVVVPIWFLAQPPDESEQRLRLVDQAPTVQGWQQLRPGAPVPGTLPEGWQPTVAANVRQPPGVRLGWNTPGGAYVEFAASLGPRGSFLEDITGGRPDGQTVDVDGTSWQRWVADDGSVSLVRAVDGVTVVVGTARTNASDAELRTLAASISP